MCRFEFAVWLGMCLPLLCVSGEDRENCSGSIQHTDHYIRVYNRTCYIFVNREMFWNEARQYCWKLGGEMLIVNNKAVMDFIITVLNSKELGWDKNGVWNGASDLRDMGWEWTTGEKLEYQYWHPGEPSKIFGFLSLENCCCMRQSNKWHWHDYHCHMDPFHFNFICQFPVKNQMPSAVHYAAPLQVEKYNKVVVTCIIASTVVMLSVIVCLLYILHRKQKRLKAEQFVIARFRDDSSTDISNFNNGTSQSSQAVSNFYHNPTETDQVVHAFEYNEINKQIDSNSGVPCLSETTKLMHVVGAASADDPIASKDLWPVTTNQVSPASSAFICSAQTNLNDEYMEMNNTNSLLDKNGTASATAADVDEGGYYPKY